MGNHHNFKHGMYRSPEYKAWDAARQRCNNPNDRRFPGYGGRGIKVCERWQSFAAFFEDMGFRPGPEYSLDRIDSAGNYTPTNCRWATWEQQGSNRSNNVRILFRGQDKTLAQWAKVFGLKFNTLNARISVYGWSIEEALTTPPQKGKKPPSKVASPPS